LPTERWRMGLPDEQGCNATYRLAFTRGSLRRQQLYRPPLLENPGIDRSDNDSTQPVA
jgi:hypothetical protein